MSSDATFGIDIVGNNRVDKGAKAAEKRLGQIPKHASALNAKSAGENERRLGRHAKAMVRTFGEVERASARAFGTRSITDGVVGRLGALRAAGVAAGSGLGEAAVAGGVLETTLAGVAIGATTVVGGLTAAAIAALKITDTFGKGALKAGNLASLIGVSTKALTEFQAAAERVGVDKGTAAGALGGLSQTLNDARYGRNPAALALIAKMGVGMQLNGDGTVNIEAMLPALADALKRQNSSGRRTAARGLGISDGALAAFTQGGAALSADMRDADKNAMTLDEDDVELGRRVTRRDVTTMQTAERRTLGNFRRGVSQGVDWAAEQLVGSQPGGLSTLQGGGAAASTASAGVATSPSGRAGGSGAAFRAGGRFSKKKIANLAAAAKGEYRRLRAKGMSPEDAAAWAAVGQAESSNDPRSRQPGGPGRGLYQWGANNPKFDRRLDFKRRMGVDIEHSTREQQYAFRDWELANKESRAASLIDRAPTAGDKAAAITRFYERPKESTRDAADRANIAEQILLTIQFENAPPGTKGTARVGGAGGPVISRALQN